MVNADSYSAPASKLGYLYQSRYALLEILHKLRSINQFEVFIECLDDIRFESKGTPTELIQTKHSLNRVAALTDYSKDIWKSIRVWSDRILENQINDDVVLYLVTTAVAEEGTAAFYLRENKHFRDERLALEKLTIVCNISTNTTLRSSYSTFNSLNDQQRKQLMRSIRVLDNSPNIIEIESRLKEAIYFAVQKDKCDSFLTRLEGWWLGRVIRIMADGKGASVLSEEIEDEIAFIREQFKLDSLPIDDEILNTLVEEANYYDRTFVKQIKLLSIGSPSIATAIRDYYRAFTHRSRWLREGLVQIGELERYEKLLVEEWQIRFDQMSSDWTEDDENAKARSGRNLYKWLETHSHECIKTEVKHPSISRGTYHCLSDDLKVGWHPNFIDRLKKLIENSANEK